MAIVSDTVKATDGLGTNRDFRVERDTGTGSVASHQVLEADGSPVGAAAPLPSLPMMAAGGMISATTTVAGTTFQAFASQPCKQLTIANNTTVPIEVLQGGSGVTMPIFVGAYFTFFAAGNASNFAVRRIDQATGQVVVQARWES